MMTKPNTPASPGRPLFEEASSDRVGLIESTHFGDISGELVEEAGKPKKFVLKGEFGRADRATENKRLYPGKLVERELKSLQSSISNSSLYGELDHPKDGRTALARAAMLITKLEMKDDGVVYGEATVLNTDRGRNLRAILEAGGRVGISSRGFGTVKPSATGESVVQDDFKMVAYDAVADPADRDAWPDSFNENTGNIDMADIANLTEDQLASENPGLLESIKAQVLRESADHKAQLEATIAASEQKLQEAVVQAEQRGKAQGKEDAVEAATKAVTDKIAENKQAIEEQVRAQFLSDPKVAGALTAMESVKEACRPYVLSEDAEAVVAEKEGQIAELQKQLATERAAWAKEKATLEATAQRFADLAKQAGFKFVLEQKVSGHPDADLIRSLVGDVAQYATVEAVVTKAEAISNELARKEKERQAAFAEQNKATEEQNAVIAQLQGQVAQLTEGLQKSIALNRQQSNGAQLNAYIAERVKFHPNKTQIIEHFKLNPPTNQSEVDQVMDHFRVPMRESTDMSNVRAQVQNLLGEGAGGQGQGGTPEPALLTPPNATPADPVIDPGTAFTQSPISEANGVGFNGTGMDVNEILRIAKVN